MCRERCRSLVILPVVLPTALPMILNYDIAYPYCIVCVEIRNIRRKARLGTDTISAAILVTSRSKIPVATTVKSSTYKWLYMEAYGSPAAQASEVYQKPDRQSNGQSDKSNTIDNVWIHIYIYIYKYIYRERGEEREKERSFIFISYVCIIHIYIHIYIHREIDMCIYICIARERELQNRSTPGFAVICFSKSSLM